MEESAERDVGRGTFTWAAATVPFTALCSGVALAIDVAGKPPVAFSGGELGALIFGGLYGGLWSLVATFPRYFLLLGWVRLCRTFGELEQSRALILVGTVFFSLPEALVVRAIGNAEVFFVAWPAIALGLFLPRLLFRSLRPGAFSV